jgi:protein gp37
MSTTTSIEWADRSWSPVLGCEKVSPGCDHCYAIRTSHRLAHMPHTRDLYAGLTARPADGSSIDWTGVVRTVPARLADPFSWRLPQRIFVNSQSDLFHSDVPTDFIAETFAVMALSLRHTFQVLTKRPARMRALLSSEAFVDAVGKHAERLWTLDGWHHAVETQWPGWPLPNLWLGVSAEDQKRADLRIPALLETPAAVRWVSAEPLLGPIDFNWLDGVSGLLRDWAGGPGGGTGCPHPLVDWVVVGCESGPRARPMDIVWANTIVADCQEAGTPVLVKQLPTGPRGRATQDLSTFPEHLRIREYPTTQEGTTTT